MAVAGELVIETKIDNSKVDKGMEDAQKRIEDAQKRIEEANKRTAEAKKKILEYEKEIAESEKDEARLKLISEMQGEMNNIGKSMKNTIKSIGRWVVAVFSIKTAYAGIRKIINEVSQKNENIGNQLKVISTAFSNAIVNIFSPVLQNIINLVAKLMMYINYIYSKLTGKALFDFSKAFADANKSSSGIAKNMNKITAGFDEMNVISDTSSAGGGGGGVSAGGIGPMQNPFEGWEDIEYPEWLDKIVEVGRWIIDNWPTVVFSLLLIKTFIDLLSGNWISLIIDLAGLLVMAFFEVKDSLIEIGKSAIELFDQVVEALEPIVLWIWENILKPILDYIGDAIQLVWSIIKSAFSVIQGLFTTLISILVAPFKILAETVKGVFDGIKTTITGIFNVIKGLFTGDWKTVMTGFKQIFKGTFDTLWSIAKAPLNLIIEGINSLIKGINKISFDVPDWVPVIGGKKWGFNIKKIPKLAKGGIINMPGKGVPVGSAIGGERAPEGVIPLTDSQQMALLGEAIGKYININATIPVYVGNRQVARELRKINAEDDFAYNG